MNTSLPFFSLLIFLVASCSVNAQVSQNPIRIEFNSGTRLYREQFIFTADSVITVKENFSKQDHADVIRRKTKPAEWKALVESLEDVSYESVAGLKSPTMNRASDAAAIGTIILTTADNNSYTHEFDDENPHPTFARLMKQIKKVTR